MAKITKVIAVILLNTLLTYIFLVTFALVALTLSGTNVREGGLLIAISPLTMVLLGGAFLAVISGVINGMAIIILQNKLVRSDRISILAIGLMSLIMAVSLIILTMLDGARGRSPYYFPVAVSFLFAIFFLSNLITVGWIKLLSRPRPRSGDL